MYITSPLISNLLLSLCRFFWPNACGIEVVSFEVLVNDRAGYRLRCFAVIEVFERKRLGAQLRVESCASKGRTEQQQQLNLRSSRARVERRVTQE